MFEYKHYVPILKGRQGEFWSLHPLNAKIKKYVTPLFEVVREKPPTPPRKPKLKKDGTPKKVRPKIDHFVNIKEMLLDNWGEDNPVFLDFNIFAPDYTTSSGVHVVTAMFEQIRKTNIKAIPVVGLSNDTQYHHAVRTAAEERKQGICIRVYSRDIPIADDGTAFTGKLHRLMKSLKTSPETTDIVIDYSCIYDVESILSKILVDYKKIPSLNEWRSISIAGSNFPKTLTDFSLGVSFIDRIQWKVYEDALRNLRRDKLRLPQFGDYAINHPIEPDEANQFRRSNPNIRYTSHKRWVILKDKKSYPKIAEKLTTLSDYSGLTYSWGDEYINNCAVGTEGVGNSTTWRKVGTNHHITMVVNQLASLP